MIHHYYIYLNKLLLIGYFSGIPTIGPYIQKPFKIALDKQKEKLHGKIVASKSVSFKICC